MKTTTSNTEFDAISVSIRSLAALTGLDRDTIRGAIGRAKLEPAGQRGGYPAYRLSEAVRCLFTRVGTDIDPAILTPQDRKALADARLREHTLHVKEGDYLPREAVRNASAEVFQMVAQSVRSIPDLCERRTGADPETCTLIEGVIDQVCSDLADRMEAMHRQSKALAGEE